MLHFSSLFKVLRHTSTITTLTWKCGDANFPINQCAALCQFNIYWTIIIKFKPFLNLNISTCIHMLQTIFFFSSLTSPQIWLLTNFNSMYFQIPHWMSCLWVLQPFCSIQSIIPQTWITIPLICYNLRPNLITSELIIKGICNHSLTTISIYSRNLHLKLSLICHFKSFIPRSLLFFRWHDSLKAIHLQLMKFGPLGSIPNNS